MSLLSKAKPTPSGPRVRTLAEADTTYADALALVHSLQGKKSALDAEENDLLFRIGNEKQGGPKAQSAKVAALLGEEPSDDLPVSGARARLTEIMGERRDLAAALDIAKSRLQHARYAASRAICEEVRGEYTARVHAVATSLQSFIAAHAGLLAIINELQRNDIAFTGHLEPLQAPPLVERAERWLSQSANFLKGK